MKATELRNTAVHDIIMGVEKMLDYVATKQHWNNWTYECNKGYADGVVAHFKSKGYHVSTEKIGWGCGDWKNNCYITIAW